jgi:putative (di)nucleoside polyphosphate hydrolase
MISVRIEKMSQERKNPSTRQSFRAGVGAVILDKRGRLLSLERCDVKNAWQLPQGGLEPGEEPDTAVFREIREETGLTPDDLLFVAKAARLLAYELPVKLRKEKTGRGQVHYWYLFRLTSAETRITLGERKEFRSWRWLTWDELMARVVDFRKQVYTELRHEFAGMGLGNL